MSLVAIVIISIITNYTGKLIVECLYEKPFNDQGARGVRLRNSYALIGKLMSASSEVNTLFIYPRNNGSVVVAVVFQDYVVPRDHASFLLVVQITVKLQ